MQNLVYLRPDVYFEPLFNKWFMWPYLMAPASAAMNVSNHHLRLLKSFVTSAKIHAKSAKDKKMTGSSLVNISIEQVPQVSALIDKITADYQDLIGFSKALKTLDEMLAKEANGITLEPLYEKVPDILRGYVELVYDLNNQPSYRLIEGLLYQSDLYKNQAQTVCLGNLPSSERPFVLSTPRLADANHLHINVPFNHAIVETLFRMRDEPMELSKIQELLAQLPMEGGLNLDDIFTTEKPKAYMGFKGDGVRVLYLGHAGLMVETAQSTLMVDPVIAYKNDDHDNKTTFEDIPESIDYVMITHTHMDHLCLETLIQLKHKIKKVLVPKNNGGSLADPSMKLMLKSLGFTDVVEMEDMESIDLKDGFITAIPFLGEHADVNIRSKAAWFINIQGQKILSAADSSNIDPALYARIHQIIGDVDQLYIGMECTGGPLRWLYGPLLTQSISKEANESRRFNGSGFDAAFAIANMFNARSVYVYALGMEPWYAYFMGIVYNEDDAQMIESKQLVDACQMKGIQSERLYGRREFLLPAKQQFTNNSMF